MGPFIATPRVASASSAPLRASVLRRDRLLAGLVLLILSARLTSAQAPSATSPRTARALYQQGLQLKHAGRLAEAEQSFEHALTLAPGNLPTIIELAKLNAILGHNDTALQLFRQAVAAAPAESENHLNLAVALATHGDLNEALLAATRAVTLRPDSVPAHHLRGKILADLDRPADAQAEYTTALALSPGDTLTLYDNALLCEAQSQLPQEISLLRRLVQLRPGRSSDHFLLGRALSRSGDLTAARAEFREAIRLDPANRAALYSLSRSLQSENPAEAAELSARFRALHVSEEELNAIRTQGNAGVAAMEQADWPRAVTLFQSALTACAGCTVEATLEKDLGLAQCRGGDLAAGTASLRRSLALNPRDLDTLQALQSAEASLHSAP